MTTAVVTPWLDHLELWPDYAEAVTAYPPTELVVVDNGSSPPLPFGTVRLEANHGFAAGCNTGLHAATSEVVVLLNNDIRMVGSTWLPELVGACEPGVLVGPALRHDRHADVDGESFPYLDGWCIAGMREDLLALGGFPAGLVEPSYYSDNILCLRARMAGMRLREVPVGLVHKISQTSGGGANPAVAEAVRRNYAMYEALAREVLAA